MVSRPEGTSNPSLLAQLNKIIVPIPHLRLDGAYTSGGSVEM